MQRLHLIPFLLILGLGCEPTDSTPAPTPPATGPLVAGVQVGSEGIIRTDCVTRAVNGTTEIEALRRTPDELLRLVEPAREVEVLELELGGSLVFDSTSLTLVEEGACPASLVVGIEGELDLDDALEGTFTGFVSFGTDLAGQVATASATSTGNLTPTDLDPAADLRVLLNGTVDGPFAGQLTFEVCLDGSCEEERIGALDERP